MQSWLDSDCKIFSQNLELFVLRFTNFFHSLDNTDDDLEKIEYAIVSDEDGRVIFCCRKNLTLVENDAKDMRKQYQVQITPKAADLSLG